MKQQDDVVLYNYSTINCWLVIEGIAFTDNMTVRVYRTAALFHLDSRSRSFIRLE